MIDYPYIAIEPCSVLLFPYWTSCQRFITTLFSEERDFQLQDVFILFALGQFYCTDVFFGHVLVPKSARIQVLQSEDTCRYDYLATQNLQKRYCLLWLEIRLRYALVTHIRF